MRHRDGHYRSIGWNIVSDTVAQRIYVIGWDVTEHRNAEEEILRRTAREQERMARNLHNSVGQLLTGLAFKAKSIEQDLRVKGTADPELAASVVRLANLVIDETRSIARNIDPVELQHGLAASLEYLAHSAREVFGVDCQVLHNSDNLEIQRSKAVNLYWIAHEAVTHAIRQGHATRITISLESAPKQMSLTVQDNALIPAILIDSSGGQEQRIMKYRAQMIGANLIFLDGSPNGRIMKCTVSFPNELLYGSTGSKEDLNNKESRGAI